jgi:hypothetical protein
MKKNLGKKRKKELNYVTEENHIEKKQNKFKFKIEYYNNKHNYVNSKNGAKNKTVFINKNENINNSIPQFYSSKINNIFNKNLQEKNKEETNQKFDLDKNNSTNMESTHEISSEDKICDKNNLIAGFPEDYNNYSPSSSKNQIESQSKNNNTQISSTKIKFQRTSRNNSFGLKEISNRVMDIIKENGQTTYKDISDQIIKENNEKNLKEERSLRRRIYDSLNVMKNLNLFNQDKQSKTIMWNYAQEYDPLNEIYDEYKTESDNIIELKKEIKIKKENANLLEKELQALKNVLDRNKRDDEKIPENKRLYFPLIIVEFFSNKEQKINVALNEDQTKAHLGFDEANFMYGDLEIISKIGNHPKFSK